MPENPWGISCTVCAPDSPCSRCLKHIEDEQAWALSHSETCEKPLGACGVCAGVFGLKP